MRYRITAAGLLILFVSMFMVRDLFAGAWTVPKGKVWAENYMKWEYAKEEFTADWKRQKLGVGKDARSWDFTMEPKVEYGVTDSLNALFSLEYKEAHYKEYGRPASWGPFTRKNNGITNVKLGGKWRFVESPFVIATQAKVFIYPGYGVNHGEEYDRNQPSIGYGNNSVEWRMLISKKIDVPITAKYTLPTYVSAEGGYIWNNRHVCNGIPYFIEGGFWPTNWLLLKTELDGYKSHDGTGSLKEQSYGIWRVGWVWQVFGDSTLREGDKLFNLEFQYGTYLWGKNATAYNEFVLKVQTQF